MLRECCLSHRNKFSQLQNHKKIVTRFAPSPTGFLHIGGARTALFNALFAKAHGGQFKLRIEDTDRARSTHESIKAILEGLSWLGLGWDRDVVSQFKRTDRHRTVVQTLIDQGAAFKCYLTPEQTQALRHQVFTDGRALRSPWRDKDPSEAPQSADFTVRFRAPGTDVALIDEVQGGVRWAGKEFDDLVLLRADSTPTYNLAVVVDDHDMGVTHIIRGDDHLVNAARQSQIYAALGWKTPVFAHIPLIHGPDGKKLSKRQDAVSVGAYRDMGYLASGLRNYLLRLGWSKGDQEYFTDAEMLESFDLKGLGKAPSRLDLNKMNSVNAWHMKRTDDAQLTDLLWSRLENRNDLRTDDQAKAWVLSGMRVLKERASTLAELEEQTYFLLRSRPIEMTGKLAKVLEGDAKARMRRLTEVLRKTSDWTETALDHVLDKFAKDEGVGFGKVGQPLRVALTGGAPAPNISFVLAVLKRKEVLERLKDVID